SVFLESRLQGGNSASKPLSPPGPHLFRQIPRIVIAFLPSIVVRDEGPRTRFVAKLGLRTYRADAVVLCDGEHCSMVRSAKLERTELRSRADARPSAVEMSHCAWEVFHLPFRLCYPLAPCPRLSSLSSLSSSPAPFFVR